MDITGLPSIWTPKTTAPARGALNAAETRASTAVVALTIGNAMSISLFYGDLFLTHDGNFSLSNLSNKQCYVTQSTRSIKPGIAQNWPQRLNKHKGVLFSSDYFFNSYMKKSLGSNLRATQQSSELSTFCTPLKSQSRPHRRTVQRDKAEEGLAFAAPEPDGVACGGDLRADAARDHTAFRFVATLGGNWA